MVTRRDFTCSGVCALAALPSCMLSAATADEGLRVKFLGTGAADWDGRDERGEQRRLTSILVEGKVLIDFTATADDMLPAGMRIGTVLYTHSHGDHFAPAAALERGVRRAYVHASWLREARAAFARAAEKSGKSAPEVIGLQTGESVEVGGVTFTILPANHATRIAGEQPALYLICKGATRLLYATDTGGIPAAAARLAGIDAHVAGTGITALVMEATMGVGHADDFRIYTHSSVDMVAQIVRVLQMTNRYHPRQAGQKVWLTHMARTLHGTQAEIASAVPSPLCPAYDGLEVVF